MIDSSNQFRRYYAIYTVSFFAFILTLGVLERYGMPPRWIGYAFLFLTIILYASIGFMARTSDVAEYYVAGRRIPAMFNGMATGADWMSAASFIGLAGTLYLTGYQGLAYVMGWTGGYVLVALLLAPYLRRFGEYTIPDFLSARYGGHAARLVGVFATVLASFVYVVAQIYGVGVITSRFVGLQFEIGVFCRSGRDSGLLFSRWHARRHLDAGGPVPGTDRRLHCPGRDAFVQGDRRSGAAGHVRAGTAENRVA